MGTLVFQLQAPLSSWGVTAVGEYRGTETHPSQSALQGLLAAALGIRRGQEQELMALEEGYGWAVGVLSSGRLLRDYHTAQVPGRTALKGRPHNTRADELRVPKDDLNTILSTRDYRQGAACLVGIQALAQAPYTLESLAQALKQPRFVLYLGRKSCPPSAPLWPQIFPQNTVREAFNGYLALSEAKVAPVQGTKRHAPVAPLGRLEKLCWSNGVRSGFDAPTLTVQRKDRLLSRRLWQFGDRAEHIRLLPREV
jgi:CRISPR system Cascade subunit CasD